MITDNKRLYGVKSALSQTLQVVHKAEINISGWVGEMVGVRKDSDT